MNQSLFVRVRLCPTELQSRTLMRWWRGVQTLEPFAARLAHSWVMRRPLLSARELIQATRCEDPDQVLDPNQPFVGHRVLYKSGGMPCKSDFLNTLLDLSPQVMGAETMPYGLLDGLTDRFYEAVAHGDSSTIGDLPPVRTALSTPEIAVSDLTLASDDAVILQVAGGAPLKVDAELFTLDPYVLSLLEGKRFRGVIQAAGGDWWLWILVKLPTPLELAPSSAQAVGIDPGIRHGLTAYGDHGRLRLPSLKPARSLKMHDRREAYEAQASAIREISLALLEHKWIGVEGTGRGERLEEGLTELLRRSFVPLIFDHLAGVARVSGTRHVVQVPNQYSSQLCPHSREWLDYHTSRASYRDCGNGETWDRDDIGAANLRERVLEFGEHCPAWWRHLPAELRHASGEQAELLFKRPAKPRTQWAYQDRTREREREERQKLIHQEEARRPRPWWLLEL